MELRSLDELERQILSGQPIDLNRVAQLQTLDLLRLGHQFVVDSLERQKQADEEQLGAANVQQRRSSE